MTDPLRTLIVSAAFGSGHKRANDAIDKAFAGALQPSNTPLETHHEDVLEYLSPAVRQMTAGIYFFWLKYMPAAYRWFYNWTDRPTAPTALSFGKFGLQAMRRHVEQVQPEVVVNSYHTPAVLADRVRQLDGHSFLNAVVITDYRVHRHWARPEAELSFVASHEAAEQLRQLGLSDNQIEVTGIPIDPEYRALIGANKAELRQQCDLAELDPELPLILLSGGGMGNYRVKDHVLAELGNLGRRVQVLELAGSARKGTSQIGGATIHHIGYTTQFARLLAASDLVVGKAGGLTMSEATALGVPMIIFKPIPGQEEYNADYLERHEAGFWIKELSHMRKRVDRALDPSEHARLSHNATALSQPDAADRIAKIILKRLGRL